MSVAELARVIGQTGTLVVEVSKGECWRVPCEVNDVRTSWGEVHFQVVGRGAGFGSPVWVKATRVTLDEN
jgi:hypothetical protein